MAAMSRVCSNQFGSLPLVKKISHGLKPWAAVSHFATPDS